MLEGLEPPKNKAVYCKVFDTLAKLDKTDYKILSDALSNVTIWPAKTLSNALRSKGVELADTTIGKHRNKNCACYRQ